MYHRILHDIIIVQIPQGHVHIDVCRDLRIHDDIEHDDIEFDDIIHDDIILNEHVIGKRDYHHVREMYHLMLICDHEVISDLCDILR